MTSPVRAPRPTPRRAEPAVAPPRRDHLRVVPEPSRGRTRSRGRAVRRRGLVFALCLVSLFGSLMASAVLHGLMVAGQAHQDDLDVQIQEERAALVTDKLELAKSRAPERIASEAEALGMVPADAQHWVSAAEGSPEVISGTSESEEAPIAPTSDELASGGGETTAQ